MSNFVGNHANKQNKINKKIVIPEKICIIVQDVYANIQNNLQSSKLFIDMLYKLTEQIAELGSPILKYYAFDWDDNIVTMPTRIFLLSDEGKEVGMTTEDYAKHRDKIGKEKFEYNGNNIIGFAENAFKSFQSAGDKDFLIDAMLAKPGPSWNDFVESINGGSIFAIITARGHSPETIKQGVYNYIISDFNGINRKELVKNLRKYRNIADDEDLSDIELIREYLNLCKFYPVSYKNENELNPENGVTINLCAISSETCLLILMFMLFGLFGSTKLQ